MSLNTYDLDSIRTGTWTILYDHNWNLTDIIDSVEFYRIITYKKGLPYGKVIDFYVNGKKQWEGYLISDEPEDIYSGKCEWFNKNGDVIEKYIITDQMREEFYYELNELLLKVLLKNDILVSYDIYIKDTLSFPLEKLYILESYNLEDYKKTLQLNLECLVLYEKILGKDHPDYIIYLSNVALRYSSLGNYSKALELNLECLSLTKNNLGKEHFDYATSLRNLASSYSDLGDYSKALELNLEFLSLIEKIFGKEHQDYAISLGYLASTYSDIGDYSKALELNLECLSILGKDHIDYAAFLGNTALLYSDLGDYSKALELNLECILFYENVFGKESANYELSLSNLALSYSNLGDYSKALELNLECLAISEIIYGKDHPKYSISLGNLAESYSSLGDYSKALELHLNCFALSEKTFGKEHPNYAIDLNNLASTYSYLGEYSKSLELYLESLEIREIIIGKEHPDYVLVLNNIASTYSDLGEYDKALELELECLALREKILGKEHPDYAVSLGNLAESYSDLGDYSKALELNLECLSLRENILGKEHPNYVLSLNNTGHTYLDLENYNAAYSFLSQSQNLRSFRFALNEKHLNNNLVTESYNFLFDDYQTLFSISNQLGSLIKRKEQYNELCFLKGRELSKNTSMVADIYQSDDEGLIMLYENWLSINRKISVCYEHNIEERKALGFDIDKLQNKADLLERQLVKGSTIFALNQRNYSFNDIISHLKPDEVFVDIVNIKSYDFDRYYAYVINKVDSIPQLIDLSSTSSLDSIYRYYSNYTQERPSNKKFSIADEYYGSICHNHFWSKMEPYLEGVSNVYFSPEGIYSKINPNVLYDSKSSSFLMDKYDIVFVSNVDDFVNQKNNIQSFKRKDDLHAVLIGNPTFLFSEEEVSFVINKNQSRAINQNELDSLQRGASLSNLPGTQTEIDLISRNLKSKGWDVELISGVYATETKVKSLDAPTILHIATHGFFFQDQKMIQRTNMISIDNKKAIANPMTRSGLIFSGAENTINGEILADDNGWLNAYEASLLNLRGTELVVLSACETGSGDVQNGKGVYGLQRAIRVAGAESLIMSMWEVDDKATQELMTYFYDYWIDKKITKKKAFKKAQQKIRKIYKHPYYWGAFIMLGK